MTTALFTDHYELTMLDAALRDGVAGRRAVFEVFSRRLPIGGRYGVFCGLGRLLDALEQFRFDPGDLDWLRQRDLVSPAALDWLAEYRFSGDVVAYREGELYGAGSPVLTVEGTFGEAVLLETLVLSILNHDSAVASAGSRIVAAARGRPIIEMGSRRTDPQAAVAAARAAYIAGFASSSNLESGRRFGVPTAGTAAHAFTLLYPGEEEAFEAQVAAFGPGTTLLVDTYDTMEGIRHAVAAAGPGLGSIRIDSGDLVAEAVEARHLLDALGATHTRVLVTGDLDEGDVDALALVPADGYGVGTAVVMGGGQPTAGFVYKLVAVGQGTATSTAPGTSTATSTAPGTSTDTSTDTSTASTDTSTASGTSTDATDEGEAMRPVAKRSPGKVGVAGRKWAWRLLGPSPDGEIGEEVATSPSPPAALARSLQIPVITGGRVVHRPGLDEIRAYHTAVRARWPADRILQVSLRP